MNPNEAGYEIDLALSTLLPSAPGIAVVHSSLAFLAPPPRVTKWNIMSAIDRFVRKGWTFAFPAFTFSFCRGVPFHILHSPSETGVLADWVMRYLPDADRTRHPIYSFAVAGPRSGEILSCSGKTAFSGDSVFGLFHRENAAVVMLGCGWEFATQFHYGEEKFQVPYRYYKTFSGSADFGSGSRHEDVVMYVRDLELNPLNDFTPVVNKLRNGGRITGARLWGGVAESATAGDLYTASAEMLREDAWSMVGNTPAAKLRAALRAEREATEPVRIAILGMSNLHFLEQELPKALARLLPERKVSIYTPAYGQLLRELADEDSALRRFAPHIAFCCDRPEDLVGRLLFRPEDGGVIVERTEEYADALCRWAKDANCPLVVQRAAFLEPGGDPFLADELNTILRERLSSHDEVLWLDAASLAANRPTRATDERLLFQARIPFSQDMTVALAEKWAGHVLAVIGKTVRALVLDLDNTLWGGVLGEDGLSGLQIGGDYPGNAYREFQRAIKSLTDRGIVLAVCSKNDEVEALDAMERLDGMLIRPPDLATHRISWREKWLGIGEIAEALHLGRESLLFVDDNAAEREKVRRHLPGVRILDLPENPEDYAAALLNSPWLTAGRMTSEDRLRAASIRAMAAIDAEKKRAVNLDDFYTGLGMKLFLQPLNDSNLARAVQLCQKTNQFNTTAVRYQADDLLRLASSGADVVVIGLEDRLSPRENIGLLILQPDPDMPVRGTIEKYLLSCRVLGRGLEVPLVHWAIRRGHNRGWGTLAARVIETQRNLPAQTVFMEAGMQATGQQSLWETDTRSPPGLPPWLHVNDFVHSQF